MAYERQGSNVGQTRGSAKALDEELTNFEALGAWYDQLNLETPNFANGYFSTPQEITAAQHLGVFNAWNALKAAAPSQVAAFRAALRAAKT